MLSFMLAELCTLGAMAQVRLVPLQLTVLADQYTPFAQAVSITIYRIQPSRQMKPQRLDVKTNDKPDLSFSASGSKLLNRHLGFNNLIPGWILYSDKQRINADVFDRPTYRPDEHGIMPRSIQGTYLDAQDMQREPLPAKK